MKRDTTKQNKLYITNVFITTFKKYMYNFNYMRISVRCFISEPRQIFRRTYGRTDTEDHRNSCAVLIYISIVLCVVTLTNMLLICSVKVPYQILVGRQIFRTGATSSRFSSHEMKKMELILLFEKAGRNFSERKLKLKVWAQLQKVK